MGAHVAVAIAVLGVSLISAAVLITARADGAVTYVTDPVSVTALAGAALAIVAMSSDRRMRDRSHSGWLMALALSVAAYLALGAVATASFSATPDASLWVGLWGAWWVVPLVVMQLAALRLELISQGWAAMLVIVTALAVAIATIAAEPTAPFVGVVPTAPEGWDSSLLLSIMTAVVCSALVVAPIALARRTRQLSPVDRASSVLATVAASVAPLLIVVCIGLAVVTSPGDVAPSLGSVAYYVVYSIGCLGAAVALRSADHAATVGADQSARIIRRMSVGVSAAYAIVIAVIAGTWLSASLAVFGTTVTVLAVSALVVGIVYFWWRLVSTWVPESATVLGDPLVARMESLSPRENEVLALVAQGARDAEIAARLHLSPRTVEAHLRRVFQKLHLEVDDGRNRRLLAARAWLEASSQRDS